MAELESDMAAAAANLDYERAALIRDQIRELQSGAGIEKITAVKSPVRYNPKSRARKPAKA